MRYEIIFTQYNIMFLILLFVWVCLFWDTQTSCEWDRVWSWMFVRTKDELTLKKPIRLHKKVLSTMAVADKQIYPACCACVMGLEIFSWALAIDSCFFWIQRIQFLVTWVKMGYILKIQLLYLAFVGLFFEGGGQNSWVDNFLTI